MKEIMKEIEYNLRYGVKKSHNTNTGSVKGLIDAWENMFMQIRMIN